MKFNKRDLDSQTNWTESNRGRGIIIIRATGQSIQPTLGDFPFYSVVLGAGWWGILAKYLRRWPGDANKSKAPKKVAPKQCAASVEFSTGPPHSDTHQMCVLCLLFVVGCLVVWSLGCSVARCVVVRHTLGEVVKPFPVCLWLPGTTLKQLSSQLLQLLFDIEGLAEKCKKYAFGYQLIWKEIQVICDPFNSYRFPRTFFFNETTNLVKDSVPRISSKCNTARLIPGACWKHVHNWFYTHLLLLHFSAMCMQKQPNKVFNPV